MRSLADYKKLEWMIAIPYTSTIVFLFFYVSDLLPLWLNLIGLIGLAIGSWWVGHFLRKKKKEARMAEAKAKQE